MSGSHFILPPSEMLPRRAASAPATLALPPGFLRAASLLLVLWASAAAAQPYRTEYTLAEVCDVFLENGRLVVEPRPLADWGMGGRGMPRRVSFTLSDLRGNAEGQYRMGQLTFKITQEKGADGSASHLSVNSQSFGLQFDYEVRGGAADGFTARYSQIENGVGASEGGFVTLSVRSEEGKPIADLRAESFALLCRRHPREATLYLGPIFRALKRSSVFSVEPRFAKLVLAEPLPDQKARVEVAALVKQLDSDDLRMRSLAARQLLRLGPQGSAQLRTLDQALLSPQQQAEIDALLQHSQAPTEAQCRHLRSDPDFLVDCLYIADDAVRIAALQQLRSVTRLPLKIDFQVEAEALTTAVESLRDSIRKDR